MSGDLVLVGTGEPGRVAAIAERLGQVSELGVDGAHRALPRARWRERAARACCASWTRAGIAMTSVEVRRPSLDDVFLTLTGRTLRDAEQKVLGMTTLLQIWLIFQRAMRQSLRNPAWVIIGIVQPVLYLALFGPLLQPLIAATPGLPARRRLPGARPRPARPARACSAACSPGSA